MLPRSSGAPARLAPPRQGRDARKLILLAMGLLFVSYFAVVNVFFSFDAAAPARDGAALGDRARAYAQRRDAQDAIKRAQQDAKTQLEEPQEEEPLPPAQVTNSSWAINPERKYVWLDVAIDDEPVGRVTIELYADLVPKTAENFRALTTGEKGPDFSFHNSVCHRILTGFIVQCGDFTTGKGYGGRSIYGAKFDDEPNGLRLTHSGRYILQMANSGPNTNGSQFCFMLGAAPHLNGKHVVFGHVVDGFDVVDRMEAAGVARDGIPLSHKVSLVDGGELIFA